jgi:folate-dependent phosphoribosylglycinamide formyltransferase PurN
MNWIALFSQTGSEINELSKLLGMKPKLCVTNNITETKYQINPELKRSNFMLQTTHKDIVDYFMNSEFFKPEETLITLHGYLRIIPPQMCEKYQIFNGHPGLITEYEQLKGKDPQERITPDMKRIGSVVHRVTEGVDEGEILSVHSVENTGGDYYNVLKQTSLEAWRKYFEQRSRT